MTVPAAPGDLPADPYVRALARLFRDDPVWGDAMRSVAVGAGSNVYFTHLPDAPWHFIKTAEGVRVRPGRVAEPDFVFRFTPAAIVALTGVKGGADAVAVTLFDLMLDPDPARHIDFRVVAPFTRLAQHGHVRLLLASGPKVLAYGATHGVYTLGQLRALVRTMRRHTPAPWEV